MQTLSKAWAAAAIRLGIAYAHPDIIGIFNNVKYPYNINILTQREALRILSTADEVASVAKRLVEERESLADKLLALPVVKKIYPSHANFLLVETTDADGLYAALRDTGVIVRNRSRVTLCAGCLRITVGTPEENALLLDAISAFAAH
jgi:histidinol-phosphate aminotransferase